MSHFFFTVPGYLMCVSDYYCGSVSLCRYGTIFSFKP